MARLTPDAAGSDGVRPNGARRGRLTPARIAGLALVLFLVVLLLAALAPIALVGAGLALVAAAGGLAFGILAIRRAERLSGEIDIVSRRLLRLEMRAALAEAQPARALPHAAAVEMIEAAIEPATEATTGTTTGTTTAAAAIPADPGDLAAIRGDAEALRGELAEVMAEIGLLGGIVRELAVAIEAHDDELAARRPSAPGRDAPVAETRAAAPAGIAGADGPEDGQGDGSGDGPGPAAVVARAARRDPAGSPGPGGRVDPPPLATPSLPTPGAAATAGTAATARPVDRTVERTAPVGAAIGEATPRAATRAAASLPDAPPDAAPDVSDRAILRTFAEGGIDLYLQPVVTLPQRRVVGYEMLARLRHPSGLMTPAEFLPVLERAGRAADLDGLVLQRAIVVARHLVARGSDAWLAYGVSTGSLAGAGFLRGATRLVEGEPEAGARLVLGLAQRAWRHLDVETAGLVAGLRARGVAFALDRATDLRFDPQALAERGVAQVKLAAARLLPRGAVEGRANAGGAPGGDLALGDLAALLGRAGVRLVAEGVERAEDVPDLIELEVPLARGGAFAPPRAVRPEVLAPPSARSAAGEIAPSPAAPEAAAGETAPEAPAPGEAAPDAPRRAFRDFLRRAS